MISTRGRYAVRILLDLAEHADGALIPMKEVAARQGISLKYIERIMPALRNSGLIESTHGIGGGYRLAKPPETVTLWEILSLAEGDLAPVALRPRADLQNASGLAGLLRADEGLFFQPDAGRPSEAAGVGRNNIKSVPLLKYRRKPPLLSQKKENKGGFRF